MKKNKLIIYLFTIICIEQFNDCAQLKPAQQLVNELTQEAYISPEMQWIVLSFLNKPEFVSINTTTGTIQNIENVNSILKSIKQQIDPQAPSISDSQKESMKKALQTMLEATEIALIRTSMKIAYNNNIVMPFAQQIQQILNQQKQAITATLNTLATQQTFDMKNQSDSYFSWWSNNKATPFSVETGHIDPQNPNVTIVSAPLMETIARVNNYKTKSNSIEAANLLFKECFISQQQYNKNNPIHVNMTQPVSANYYIFSNYPNIYNKSLNTYPICEQIIRFYGKNSLQFLLEVRQAIQTALYIANKNSVMNVGYILPTSITSYLDGIVSELMQYDAHLATLCTNPLYGAKKSDITQASQWSSITKLAIGTIGVAAVGGAILAYDPQALNKVSDLISEQTTGVKNWFNGTPTETKNTPSMQSSDSLKLNTKSLVTKLDNDVTTEKDVSPQNKPTPTAEELRALEVAEETAKQAEIDRLEKEAAQQAEKERIQKELQIIQDQIAQIAQHEIEKAKQLAAEKKADDELKEHYNFIKNVSIAGAVTAVGVGAAIKSVVNQPVQVRAVAANKKPIKPYINKNTERNLDGSKIVTYEYSDGTLMKEIYNTDFLLVEKVIVDPRNIPNILTFFTPSNNKFLVKYLYTDQVRTEIGFNTITGNLTKITYIDESNEEKPNGVSCTIESLAVAYLNFQLEPEADIENIRHHYYRLLENYPDDIPMRVRIKNEYEILIAHTTYPDQEINIAVKNKYDVLKPEHEQVIAKSWQSAHAAVASAGGDNPSRQSNVRHFGGNEVKGADIDDILDIDY